MATFQLSPGVNWSEYDLTEIIPAVATSPGAIAGVFSWGPIGELTLITSEANLVAQFGTPTNNNYETWFTAKSFLDYTNTLWVVRGANTTADLIPLSRLFPLSETLVRFRTSMLKRP